LFGYDITGELKLVAYKLT